MGSKLQARGAGVDALRNGAGTAGLRRKLRWVAYTVFALAFLVLFVPVIAVLTPFGQQIVADTIERPLLVRLKQSVPLPFILNVTSLETRVRPSYIEVQAGDITLTSPGMALEVDQMDVRIRYIDVLRQNLIPRTVFVDRMQVAVEDLALATRVTSDPSLPANRVAQSQADPDLVTETQTSQTALTTAQPGEPQAVTSDRFDQLIDHLGTFDALLSELTQGTMWAAMRTLDVESITVAGSPDSPFPLLRAPDPLTLSIDRESPTELIARLTTVGREDPLRLVVRHAETGVPEGPAMLAEVAGTSSLEGHAFSHVLLYGLRTRDLTSALTGDGPIVFDSELAMEMVVARAEGSRQVDQVAILLESGSGYLIASGREATILEGASLPLLYTRQSGRFDIVSASLEFQETGGIFSGHIRPQIRNGQAGLGVVLNAPRYNVAVPPSQELGRLIQRGTAQIALRAHIPDNESALDLPLLRLGIGEAVAGFSGRVEFAGDGPVVSLAGQSTPMNVDQLGALWPLPLSPLARSWFLDHIVEGQLQESQFSFVGRLSDIEAQDGRAYLPDDMMALDVPYTNLVLRTPGDLPLVFGLDGTLQVTGRTVTMTGDNGVGRLEEGENIAVGPVAFHIPDHALEDPEARLDLALSGPASGFVRMAVMDPILMQPQDVPFNPDALSGQVTMTATIEAILADRIDRDTVDVAMQADVTGFASQEPIEERILTDGSFALSSDSDGLLVDGTANLDGVPTEIAFSTADESGLQVSMRLDAAGRERIGLDFGPYLSGVIGVDVGTPDDNNWRTMQIDLTDAALTIAELGWSKPPGQPATASFDVREQTSTTAIDNLSIAADGLAIRGSLRMEGTQVRQAQFDSIAVEGVGRFALALTSNGQDTSARITGERLVLQPDLLRGNREEAGDLSLELALDQLVTEDGARLDNMRLTYAQTGDRITAFDLRAQHTDGTDLVGSLSPQGNTNLIISSGNAGTFLRFLGLYERAQGGRATLVLDSQSVGGRLAGQLLLSDFEIVGEPAMERIFNSGSQQVQADSSIVLPGTFETADRIEIEATNITFDRTPERLVIHNAEGWGPSLGGNIEGVIDYQADRMELSGTYVPFFTINNIFSRIPLIGQALGNRDTEGLLGITFELVGSIDSPELRVNPISLLAPGVFRNIFEYQQGG